MSDDTRAAVLAALSAEGVPAKALATKLDLGYSTVTQHLRALAEAGAAVSTKDGSRTLWSAAPATPGRVEITPDPIDDFDRMLTKDLRAYLKERKVPNYTRMARPALLAAARETRAVSLADLTRLLGLPADRMSDVYAWTGTDQPWETAAWSNDEARELALIWVRDGEYSGYPEAPATGAPASADMPVDTGAVADQVAAGNVTVSDALVTIEANAAPALGDDDAFFAAGGGMVLHGPDADGDMFVAPYAVTEVAPVEGDPGAYSIGMTRVPASFDRPAQKAVEPLKPWERAVTPNDRLPYVYDALSVPRDGMVDALTRRPAVKPAKTAPAKRANARANTPKKAVPKKAAVKKAEPKKKATRAVKKTAPKGRRWGHGELRREVQSTLLADPSKEWTAAAWARRWNESGRAAGGNDPVAQSPSVVDAFDALVRDGRAVVVQESGPRTWRAYVRPES